jgi:hypothetical protein
MRTLNKRETSNALRILVEFFVKRPIGKLSRRCDDNIKLVKWLWKQKGNGTAFGSCAVAKFGI